MTMTEVRAADQFATARRAMIDSQLRTSGVNEPWVLAAINGLLRENFVPEESRAAAYSDRAVPLGNGSFLAAPLVHARMLSEAAPTSTDRALLIGDSQGYLTALLRPLVGSLDCVAAASAGSVKGKVGHYSLIVIDGAAQEVPAALVRQLADDGRLVTGMVQRGITRLAVGRKAAGQLALLPLAELGIPVLAALSAPKRWAF